MAGVPLRLHDVSFAYESSALPVFDGLSLHVARGWTGVIGPNGSGKTTLLRLACGELTPQRGRIESPERAVYCPQRTDDPPTRLPDFLNATDRKACALRGQLAIQPEWADRWSSLSHGERKRAQIAVALWLRPQVLAVDEPTNHIDLAARRMLAGALKSFRGIGLLVSHDRHLLDTLCRRTLMVDPPRAIIRPGGYTKAVELARAEQERVRRERSQARDEFKRVRQEAARRQRDAARASHKRSKRKLKPKEHDAREKIDRARISGKDGHAGRVQRQLTGRLEQARERLDGIRAKKNYRLGVEMRGERARRDALFRVPPGSLALGGRSLVFPELMMAPDDRIALTGPNGAGKSTLVRHIVGRLGLPEDKFVYLAQEIDASATRRVIEDVRRLPRAQLGDVMTFVSCLGSRPERLLETEEPSPGELRKIMLALGVSRSPWLIVMDEPTNHLDLPSIECLEEALDACVCGLLLVSHDQRFLDRLTRTRWDISSDESDESAGRMRLQIVGPPADPGV